MPPAVEVTPAGERVEPPRDPHQEALALYRRGQYAEAVERLSGQASPAALALAARAHANQGQLVEALAGCDQAITADKLNPALRYLRALILQEQRQVDEARASLREALYLDPRFILAHFALGNLASRQARPREAAKHFENTLALLHTCRPEEGLPEGEGLTAGRLAEMIRAAMDEAQASDERKGRS
jgi:chemotaxis protein methyltransferase CheR